MKGINELKNIWQNLSYDTKEMMALTLAVLTIAAIVLPIIFLNIYIKAYAGLALNWLIFFGFWGAGFALGMHYESKARSHVVLGMYLRWLLSFAGMAIGIYLVAFDAPERNPGDWPRNYSDYFDYSVSQLSQVWKIIAAALGLYKGVESLLNILKK